MPLSSARPRSFSAVLMLGALPLTTVSACSSSNDTPPGSTSNAAKCTTPGVATAGSADTHCQGRDAQPVSAASCTATASDAGMDMGDGGMDMGDGGGSEEGCEYGATEFGHEGDDDDCKYHASWTSTPLCQGSGGVVFTVTLTTKADGKPVTGVPKGISPEAFIPTDPGASCDTQSTHPSPTTADLVESPAGSGVYTGPIVFDAPGQWTVRFHIHEECTDVLEDSPHGHVAFRVTVP